MANGLTVAVLGCGTMGMAIVSGVLSSSAEPEANSADTPSSSLQLDPASRVTFSRFIACVSREESARRLRKHWANEPRCEVRAGGNVEACREADVVLLCVKPQMASAVLSEPGMAEALEGRMLVSILAGKTIAQLCALAPKANVVRAMPNTPCKIREGMTVMSTIPANDELSRQILLSLFSPIGLAQFLDEKLFDVATALCGSGPAMVFLVIEAMADGAVAMGMPRKAAIQMAAQTVQGSGRLVLESGDHPASLKDSVTTPAGCTIAGLLTLEDGRLRSTMARAIESAANRASELAEYSSAPRASANGR